MSIICMISFLSQRGRVKIGTFSKFITKPRLPQARALLCRSPSSSYRAKVMSALRANGSDDRYRGRCLYGSVYQVITTRGGCGSRRGSAHPANLRHWR